MSVSPRASLTQSVACRVLTVLAIASLTGGCSNQPTGATKAPSADDRMAQLEDEDPSVRRTAASLLGAAPLTEEAVRALAGALDDEDQGVREAVAMALRGAKEYADVSVPALEHALADEAAPVRRAAASALGTTGPEAAQAMPGLLALCKDKDRMVRIAAITAIGEVDPMDKRVVPVLIDALEDRSTSGAAANAISKIDPTPAECAPALLAALERTAGQKPAVQVQLVSALENLGPDGVPQLIEALDHEDALVRIQTLAVLTRMGPEAASAAPALLAKIRAGTVKERVRAAEALFETGATSAATVAAVVALFEDALEEYRTAFATLGDLGPDLTIDALWQLRKSAPDEQARRRAEIASRAYYSCDGVIRLLAKLGPEAKSATPILESLIDDRFLGSRAAGTLWRVERNVDVAPIILEKLLSEPVTDPEIPPHPYPLFAEMGPTTIPLLIELLSSANARARAIGAAHLTPFGPDAKEAVPALTKLLEDEDPAVRISACRALWSIEGNAEKVVPVLAALFEECLAGSASSTSSVLAVLTEMGPAAKAALPALQRVSNQDLRLSQAVQETIAAIQANPDQPPGRPRSVTP